MVDIEVYVFERSLMPLEHVIQYYSICLVLSFFIAFLTAVKIRGISQMIDMHSSFTWFSLTSILSLNRHGLAKPLVNRYVTTDTSKLSSIISEYNMFDQNF